MKYLFVVAHPDDEVLGGGATIHTLVEKGEEVAVCILCGKAESRSFRSSTKELFEDMQKSQQTLGVTAVKAGNFHDSNLNIYPHSDVVYFIEEAIIEFMPETIITHHPSDLNSDHQITSKYCQEAARLSQRKTENIPMLKQLLYMEVLSSTDWMLDRTISSFSPNLFIEVGEESINKKISALAKYRKVMRSFPHPRSKQIIKGLAAYRGGQSATKYAEAYEIAFRVGL